MIEQLNDKMGLDSIIIKPAFYLLLFLLICLLISNTAFAFTVQAGSASTSNRGQGDERYPLSPGISVKRSLAGGESHLYEITVAGDQYIRLSLYFEGTYVELSLCQPNEEMFTELQRMNLSDGGDSVSAIGKDPGVYKLRVRATEKYWGTVHYELKLEELRSLTPEDDFRIDAVRKHKEAIRLWLQNNPASLQAALLKYQEVADIWRKIKDISNEAYTLLYLGAVHHSLGEEQDALDLYNQARNLYKSIGDRSGEARSLYYRGYYSVQDDKKGALGYLGEAVELYRAAGNSYWEGRALETIADVYSRLGDRQQQIDYLSQSLVAIRRTTNRAFETHVLIKLSEAYNLSGERQKEESFLNAALSLYQSANNLMGQVAVLDAIGVFYDKVGEPQKAIDAINRAIQIEQSISNPGENVYSLNVLGLVYHSIGEKQKAFDLFNKAVLLSRKAKNKRGEATSLNNLGFYYSRTKDAQLAIDYYGQALQLYRQTNNQDGVVLALSNIGNLQRSMGRFQQALGAYNEALKINKTPEDRVKAYILSGLGSVNKDLGENEKAIGFYHEALTLVRSINDRREEAFILYDLANAERNSSLLSVARTHIEEALDIIETLRTKIAGQETRNLFFTSVRYFYEFYIDLLMQLQLQQPSKEFNITALQASERARARSLLELLTEGRLDIREGVDHDLLDREHSLRERLNARADYQVRLLNGKHTDEQKVAIAKEINALITQYREIQAQIRVKSPKYAELTQPSQVNFKQIQERLIDPDTMLLEYWLGPRRSYLWAITQNSINSYELPNKYEITALVAEAYKYLAAHRNKKANTDSRLRARLTMSEAHYKKVAVKLSEILLSPVASQLGSKRLLIIADGALEYLPFIALPSPLVHSNNTRGMPTRGQSQDAELEPLIVKHEIIGLPSASVISTLSNEAPDRKDKPTSIAIFADPVFEDDDPRIIKVKGGAASVRSLAKPDLLVRSAREVGLIRDDNPLPRLHFTREEAEYILSYAPPETSLKALGLDATKPLATSLDPGKYTIVHFATHGILNTEHPELSGVVLSLFDKQGGRQDGFLHLNDIYNLREFADLVVLSGCNTGFGNDTKGEGFSGLTRAFIYAGAKSVIASLWSVQDESTSKLMKFFYKQLLIEKRTPAAALRAAQLQMWRQTRWKSPYFWAAFTIQGKWT